MDDIIDTEEVDRDIVEQDVLEEQFKIKYKLITESAVSLNKSYINKLHGNKALKLAVSLSDNSIEVYQLNNTSLTKVCRLSGHSKGLTEVVCDPKDEHLVYSAGEDGVVKLWDTRASGTYVTEYQDDKEELLRPYLSMDVSCNGRVLCAGSQLVEDDAYLVFWDQRLTKPLGGYWNSHTDDINQVKFHKTKTEVVATGSLDGLINIYNLMEQTEDDALTYSLNAENSPDKLSWSHDHHLTCITQSNDLQVWDTDSGDLLNCYTRDKVSRTIKRSKGDDCYLVDTYTSNDDSIVAVAGSYGGDGHMLRSVSLVEKKLLPRTNFTENKQTVQSCWYNYQHDILVTSGESGIISVWSGSVADNTASSSDKVAHNTNKLHKKRHKPY